MKKTLVYICGDIQLKDRALNFLNTTRQEAITIQSNVASDLQPFGSVVKSILISAYKENVTDVYIVVSKLEDHKVLEGEMREWLEKEGVEKEAFYIFDYLDQYNKHALSDWLAVNNVEKTINKNLNMLKSHPFLPKKLNFIGLILNETYDFKVI